MTAQTPPEREALYLKELAARLHAAAGEELVGVYVGGSVALDAYDIGRSDLDVAAVVRFAAPRKLKDAIVDAIRHESLPCPARGLEFVLYRLGATCEPPTDAGFELNPLAARHRPGRAAGQRGLRRDTEAAARAGSLAVAALARPHHRCPRRRRPQRLPSPALCH
jgi:hypothetical protein